MNIIILFTFKLYISVDLTEHLLWIYLMQFKHVYMDTDTYIHVYTYARNVQRIYLWNMYIHVCVCVQRGYAAT